jgi:hypothetical protein
MSSGVALKVRSIVHGVWLTHMTVCSLAPK